VERVEKMSQNNHQDESFISGVKAPETYLTQKSERIEHWITDEELSMLDDNKSGHSKDIFFASCGVLFGSFTTMARTVSDLNKGVALESPLVDLLHCMFFAAALALMILTGILWGSRSKNRNGLIGEIRGRDKFRVGES